MARNSRTNKTAITITALILVVMLVIAYVSVSIWRAAWNPKQWINPGTTIEQPNEPDDDYGGNAASGDLVNVTEENGISLMTASIAADDYGAFGIDTQADKAYSITATVNSDAVDKSVIGSISFANASSSWANGKKISDYATLTQTTEYGLNFTLTVKQAFGEPIIVTVASLIDHNVKGTAKVNYLKTLNSFTATLNPSIAANAAGRIYAGDTSNTVQLTPVYGVGTVEGTITNCTTIFTINSFTETNLTSALNSTGFHCTKYMYFEGLTFKIPLMSTGNISFKLPGNAATLTAARGLVQGGGNTYPPLVIANNFIVNYGCTNALGSTTHTAGVSSIKYDITYSYGNDYSVILTYTDSEQHFFRNDNLTAIATVTNINVGNDIVVIPD